LKILKIGMNQSNMMVLLHHTNERTNDSAIAEFRLSPEMIGIKIITSNIDGEGEQLREQFNNFLCNIIADAHKMK